MKRLLILGILFALVTPLQAAKVPASLEIAPAPVHAGDIVTFSGCGYGSRAKDIYVEIYSAAGEYTAFATHTEGTTGCWSFTGLTFPAGDYEVYVFPDRSPGDGFGTYQFNHATLEADFEVLP